MFFCYQMISFVSQKLFGYKMNNTESFALFHFVTKFILLQNVHHKIILSISIW